MYKNKRIVYNFIMNTSLSEREKKILQLLTDENNLTVNEISSRLNVSRVTVRSDFNSLEEKGLLVRMRGGAFPAFHPEILESQRTMVDEKTRIAKAAASMISDGDTVMINDGTTSSLIPKFLLGKRDIRIVTNSTLIFTYARINPALNLTLVGGEFRPSSEAVVGPIALKNLENYHVKYAFLGTGGFSAETGFTSQLVDGAEIFRKMCSQAEKVVVVADSSKYGRNGFVKIFPINRTDILITDTGLTDEAADRIREENTQIILV